MFMGAFLDTAEWWQVALLFVTLLIFQPVRLYLLSVALRLGGVPKDEVAKILIKNADKDKLIDLLRIVLRRPSPPATPGKPEAIEPKPPGDDPTPDRPRAVS